MKIVINACFGGFGLSDEAQLAYAKRKEFELRVVEKQSSYTVFERTDGKKYYDRDIARDDSDLVAVVEELGEKANGSYAKLKIVEIPDGIDWEIDEYDGKETVDESHRSWS